MIRFVIFTLLLLSPTIALTQSVIERTDTAEKSLEMSNSTDARLLGYISNRMVLPSGLTVKTWRWTKEAGTLGYANYPAHGLIAQDVQAYFPHAVSKTQDGYLVIDKDILAKLDISVATLIRLCGEIYSCSDYRKFLLEEKNRQILGQ